jgi:hypothetical protein
VLTALEALPLFPGSETSDAADEVLAPIEAPQPDIGPEPGSTGKILLPKDVTIDDPNSTHQHGDQMRMRRRSSSAAAKYPRQALANSSRTRCMSKRSLWFLLVSECFRPFFAEAQQPERITRIGFLSAGSSSSIISPRVVALRQTSATWIRRS